MSLCTGGRGIHHHIWGIAVLNGLMLVGHINQLREEGMPNPKSVVRALLLANNIGSNV